MSDFDSHNNTNQPGSEGIPQQPQQAAPAPNTPQQPAFRASSMMEQNPAPQPQQNQPLAGQMPPYRGAQPQPGMPAGGMYGGSQFQPQPGAPFHPGSPQPPQPQKAKKKRSPLKTFLIAILCVAIVGGGIGGAVFLALDNGGSGDSTKLETKESPTVDVNNIPDSGELTAEQIAAKVKPSVIGILVYNKTSSGEGSGVIMGEDSTGTYTYILTCAHVINGFTNVKIQMEDETQYDAEIVGMDNRTDIGVIRVRKTGFTAAEFGNSDALKVGNPVYAIGNPGGTAFYGSVTNGIVSAIDRPTSSEAGYTTMCIQHTAAINPGNSGGALVNKYGQVIGINSSKIAADQYEGMGFAVPMATVKQVADAIIANGYVPNRPMLGITYYSVYANSTYGMIAQLKGLPKGAIVVNSITQGGAMDGSDVRSGDIITQVNGKDLETSDSLREVVENSKVGDKLTLTVCRIGNNYEISEFKAEITLVEDRGTASSSSDTTEESTQNNNGNGGNSDSPFNFGR